MKLIAYSDLNEKKGIKYSRVHIARLEKADKFPKHVNLGPQSIGWLEEEIDAWIEARAAERPSAPRSLSSAQVPQGNAVDPVVSAEQRKTENAELALTEQGAVR